MMRRERTRAITRLLAAGQATWLLLGGGAVAAEAAGDRGGAAWPKGQYAQLNSLPDWGGVWVLRMRRAADGAPPAPAPQPKLKGQYLADYLAWQQEVRDNNGVVRRETSNCMPPGMPWMMGTGQYPIEFLFTPGRVTTHHEAWMQWRSIYTDGRGHPEDLEPGIFGHSIGRWEGDTLVVETVGIKTITQVAPGVKHSDKLKITERFRQAPDNPDLMLLHMTMEDPDALEEPFVREIAYVRQRDWSLMEFICAENDRNPIDAEGYTQYH